VFDIMNKKNLLFFLLIFSLIPFLFGETRGYISFEYIKGQAQADVPHGSFQNAQAGLFFSGAVMAKVFYVSEIRFIEENQFELNQALISYQPSTSFNLKLGLYLVPFGKYNLSSRPHQTMLVNDPLNVEYMFPSRWRDIGILFEGRTRSFFYSAYLGNGLSESENLSGGQQYRDNNVDKGKGGRVGIALNQWSEIAYSYFNGKYDEDNSRDLVLHGVDLVWSAEGFQILSEYSKAYLDNPEGLEPGEAEGYFVQLSFNMGAIRPVVSYQKIKYEDRFHGPGFLSSDTPGTGILEEKSRWALGLVWSVSQNFFLKFEYDFNREEDLELKDDSFSLQAALSF